jgi:hypothetical protein
MSVTRYGKTEAEISAEASLKCRRIVSEIVNFGVSQSQILHIIKLLALELEDRETMVRIVKSLSLDEPSDAPSKEDATPALPRPKIIV